MGMNSSSTIRTVSVCLRHRLHMNVFNILDLLSRQNKDSYLKPDFAFCFPLAFLLSTEVLVPNSPRIGWDIV